MARVSPFTHPLMLGFDGLEQVLDRVGRLSNDGYPPFNIERTADDAGGVYRLRIVLAVAGFSEDDLSITVEGRELVIRGKQTDDDARTYLHRGIAARQFVRVFVLAEGLDVEAARLSNGLLSIDLVKPEKPHAVRRIDIGAQPKHTAQIAADQDTPTQQSGPMHHKDAVESKRHPDKEYAS